MESISTYQTKTRNAGVETQKHRD